MNSTPKAFANSSPGFALKPGGARMPFCLVATLKELRSAGRYCVKTLSGLSPLIEARFPGLRKRNPGLELANAFSVKITLRLHLFTEPSLIASKST